MGCIKNSLTKLPKIWDPLDYKVKLWRTATWDLAPIIRSCRSLISISTLYGNSPTYFLYSARALSQFIYALTWCLGFGVQLLLQEAPEWKGLDVFKRTEKHLKKQKNSENDSIKEQSTTTRGSYDQLKNLSSRIHPLMAQLSSCWLSVEAKPWDRTVDGHRM